MKYPKIPTKPYAPYKPQPPAKQIEHKTIVGKLTSQEDNEFTLAEFSARLQEEFPGIDVSNIKFSMEVITEYGYYDDVSHSLNVNVFTTAMIDNPNYDKLYASYEQQLEKYKKDYQKYRDDLKQYVIDEKIYQEELDKWALDHAKKTVKRLEPKVKGKKK